MKKITRLKKRLYGRIIMLAIYPEHEIACYLDKCTALGRCNYNTKQVSDGGGKQPLQHPITFPQFKLGHYLPPVFYSFIKFYARLTIKIYCRKIIVNKPELLNVRGPVLLACNHPNSFLDGMIITTLFDEPVHSLARGDAFKNKRVNKFLRSMQLLPVYRTSEGVENLEHNYTTFSECIKAFEKKEVVLIFSEGRCENEWHLRPLKKGTARLAVTAWEKGIPLQVIPTAINYSSFKSFGKEVHLFFGEPLNHQTILSHKSEGKKHLIFNELLAAQLKQYVYEIDAADKAAVRKKFSLVATVATYFLLLPAIIGWLIHAPLFYGCQMFSKKFYYSGHFDSVQTSLLLLLYPFYLLLLFFISAWLVHPLFAGVTVFASPFLAWAAVRVKIALRI